MCNNLYYYIHFSSTEFRQKLLTDTFELDVLDEERLTTTVIIKHAHLLPHDTVLCRLCSVLISVAIYVIYFVSMTVL